MAEQKNNHAEAVRAWAGLRARLKFAAFLDESGSERLMRSRVNWIGCLKGEQI